MRRSAPALTALGLMIAVLATACGEPAVTTTSPPPGTTTTEAAPVTSEEVALAFFNAWQAGDRELMEQLSEPSALAADSLTVLASETWEPELCEGAAGTVHCIWISDAGTLAIGVRNIEEPHVVTSFGLVDP